MSGMSSTLSPPRTWSLVALCKAAGVSRWAGRAAIEAGLLRAHGWGPSDVIRLRTAAAVMALRSDAPEATVASRNRTAVSLATVVVAEEESTPGAVVLVGRDRAASVSTGRTDDFTEVLATFAPDEVVAILPVGQWIAQAGQVMPG